MCIQSFLSILEAVPRICINRGGIPPLEHISSWTHLLFLSLHLILKYFEMANSRAFFSDLKSGKCSLKLCCRVNLYFSLLFIVWWQGKRFYSSLLFQSSSKFSKGLFFRLCLFAEGLWRVSCNLDDHSWLRCEKDSVFFSSLSFIFPFLYISSFC